MSEVEKLRAERDAALAAVERVRAIHTRGETRPGEYFCTYPACESYWPCPTITALDGAPEPDAAEKKYAIEYSSKTRTSIHEQESLESARVELARIPHPNGRIMQQVVAPWLPVEGEKP